MVVGGAYLNTWIEYGETILIILEKTLTYILIKYFLELKTFVDGGGVLIVAIV